MGDWRAFVPVAEARPADVGQCNRCGVNGERFPYEYEVRAAGGRVLVMTDRLCASCLKKAVDKQERRV